MVNSPSAQENDERYRLLIEHSRDLICELGRAGEVRGHFLYLSPNYFQVLGYQPEELLNTNAFALVHPEDLQSVLAKFSLDSATATFRYQHKDGSWRWLECTGQIFKTSSGDERGVIVSRDITERKLAEDRLRESEANMASAQHMARVGSWELDLRREDPLTHPQLWSDEVFRIFGHKPGSIAPTHENFSNAIHLDDREMVRGVLEAAVKNHSDYSVDYRIVLPNGFERTVHEQARIVRDSEIGIPLKMFGVVQDITDRKHVETALRESQARWRSLVENVPDMIMTLEKDGTILFVNGKTSQCVKDRINGLNVSDLVPEESLHIVMESLERVFSTGNADQFQMSKTEGRSTLWYSGRIGPIRNEDKIVAATLIVTDITEQKRVEESLRESEARFRQIAENIEEVFWMVDYPGNSRLLYVSPAYEKVWGKSCQSLYENPPSFLDAVHPDDHARVETNSRDLQAEGRYDEIYRIIRPDGQMRWIRDRAFPIRNETGEIYRIVGLAEDITERKQIETQFFQSQKMEAFGKLAGGVAHDFNNLLTVITGYNEIVLNAFNPNDPRRDCVEEIGKAAERATALTGQLLAFSRQQVLQPRIIVLNKVLDSIEKMLRRLIGEDVTLNTDRAENLGLVKADPGQIENVLMNLAVNARDAMPGGGTLTIRTENIVLPQEEEGVPAGSYAVMSVTDTGVGIPEHIRSQIFEPFFTTKPVGHGTGLGLATCYGIIKQSGGFITVESQVNVGSTFKIFLPIVREEEGALSASSTGSGALPQGNETILFVEDEPNVRKLAVHALKQLGYSVVEASNGEEAFHILRSVTPGNRLDLVITDVVMPQMGGRDLALWIRAMNPEIKIMFTSGYPDHAFDDADLLDENSSFISKPFAPKMLAVKVRELLDRKPDAA